MTSQGIEVYRRVCRVCLSEKLGSDFPGPRGKTCTLCRKQLVKGYHKKYNAKRPPETPERKQSKADWFSNNKELWDAKLRRRRAAKRNAEGSHTEAEWQELLDSTGNVCLCCKRGDVPLTRDHVTPLMSGGGDYITNIQPLCRPCNSRKQLKDTDYR